MFSLAVISVTRLTCPRHNVHSDFIRFPLNWNIFQGKYLLFEQYSEFTTSCLLGVVVVFRRSVAFRIFRHSVIPSFSISGDFPLFRLLGFWEIFRRSAVPSFRIWNYFPPFRDSIFWDLVSFSAVPSFRLLGPTVRGICQYICPSLFGSLTLFVAWMNEWMTLYFNRVRNYSQDCSLPYGPMRPLLYGLGYPRQPFPRVALAEATFILFLSKIQWTVYIVNANSSRGTRQLGWASCLTSAGRVILASGTTFLHINALARLPGTVLGVASVT